MKSIRWLKAYASISILAFFLLLPQSLVLAQICSTQFAHLIDKNPVTYELLQLAEDFAKANQLPTQVLETGPSYRKIKRLYIGLDITKPEQLKKYAEAFHLEGPQKQQLKGSVVLDFQREQGAEYVYGALRTSPKLEEKTYRWARPTDTGNTVHARFLQYDRGPIAGYSYVIGLTQPEIDNVKFYLNNPTLRAPCKSDNCIAWISSMELKKTGKDVPDNERGFLFSELGVSRSLDPAEISRRLANASNEKESVIFVYYKGDTGKAVFETSLFDHLPKDPKVPYINIVKGMQPQTPPEIRAAFEGLKTGDRIFFPIGAGASPEGFYGLTEAASLNKISIEAHMLVNGISESTINNAVGDAGDTVKIKALFLGSNLRKAVRDNKVDLVPGYLGDFPRWMRDPDMPQFKYTHIVVRVSPPDELGKMSLGPNADMIKAVIESNPQIKIIAEINPNVPKTTGDNFITTQQVFRSFPSQAMLAGPPVVPFTKVEQALGQNIASLITNGATVQIGIGNAFAGLPSALKKNGTKDLKIFTEMFGDQMKTMIEEGIASDAKTGFAYGSPDLYKWLDGNKKVQFVDTEIVNDPAVVAQTEKFHAINTALQVDLRGNANATNGPEARISSPGGQVEFMAGASKSKGGKAIMALRSTAKNGSLSTISVENYPGSVTTPHEMVSYVVTEYGIAKLAGATEQERAVRLINIAHPKFRQELYQKAFEKKILTSKVGINFWANAINPDPIVIPPPAPVAVPAVEPAVVNPVIVNPPNAIQ